MNRDRAERGDPSDAFLVEYDRWRQAEDAELVERVEVESAATSWSSVVAASIGSWAELVTTDGTSHRGRVSDSGDGWALLRTEYDDRLVMLKRVVLATGLHGTAAEHRSPRGAGAVLRSWARTGAALTTHVDGGAVVRGQVGQVLGDAVIVRTDTERVLVPLGGMLWASVPPGAGGPGE